MYPEKLTFDGFALRTNRINEVVRLIYSMEEGFSENKNRTNGNKSDLSCNVGLLGFEPRRTESKSVVLPLHYNPIVSLPALRIRSAKIRFQPFSAKSFLVYLFENIKKQQCNKNIAEYVNHIIGAPA